MSAYDSCLEAALARVSPVGAEELTPKAASGHIRAKDAILPADQLPMHEALRAGISVASLDLVGASAQIPVPLLAPVRVVPEMALPPGMDAVLPDDAVEESQGTIGAIRPGRRHPPRRA